MTEQTDRKKPSSFWHEVSEQLRKERAPAADWAALVVQWLNDGHSGTHHAIQYHLKLPPTPRWTAIRTELRQHPDVYYDGARWRSSSGVSLQDKRWRTRQTIISLVTLISQLMEGITKMEPDPFGRCLPMLAELNQVHAVVRARRAATVGPVFTPEEAGRAAEELVAAIEATYERHLHQLRADLETGDENVIGAWRQLKQFGRKGPWGAA